MPESVSRILRLLERASRRFVWLGLARAAALGAAAVGIGWIVATFSVNDGGRALAFAGLVLGGLAALGLVAWRMAGFARTRRVRAQAERLESLHPELRGSLLTVVDRVARPLGSPGLVARLADEVAGRIRVVEPAHLWPARLLWTDARWAVLVGMSLVLVALRAPVGPLDTLRLLFGGSAAEAAVAPVAADGPHALLGDITLRYEYPAYTRLEPLEVPNTSGEVHAPPGTVVRIRARAANSAEGALLEVTGAEPVAAEVQEDRQVSAAFTLSQPGVWRLRYGGLSTRDFAIVPDPDLAPVVAVSGRGSVVAATLDGELPVRFNAKDDYGITRLVVEVNVQGRVQTMELRAPLDAPLTVAQGLGLSAVKLGLHAGDRAKMRVGAWDNDGVAGSKLGWSPEFTLQVGGARGDAATLAHLREELFAVLVPLLSENLLDSSPPAAAGPPMARWGELAESRYEAFDTLVDGAVGLDRRGYEARTIDTIQTSRRELLAFVRGLPPGELSAKDGETLGQLQIVHVRALELAVWSLDRKMRMAAEEQLAELVKALAEEAHHLRDEAPQLSRPQTLARIDKLSRLEDKVQSVAARLDRGSIRAFLDARGTELEGAIARARRDVAAGDGPAVKVDLARVADLLDELAGGVDEAQKRSQGGGEELQKEIDALRTELPQLAKDQAALQRETDAARDKYGQSLEKGLAAWKAVDVATQAAKAALADPALKGPRNNRSFSTAADDAGLDASGLGDSVRARDAETALSRAGSLRGSLGRARMQLQRAVRGGQVPAAAAAAADAALERGERSAAEAERQLEKLAAAQSETSPGLQSALQKLAAGQGELAERAQKTAARAQKVARAMPSDASALEEAAGEGASEAGRATGALGDGDAMGASGAQASAADAFERAAEALEQAVQDAQSPSGEGSDEGDPGAPSGGDQGDGNGPADDTSIPAPEEFQTPEAYRKALLEGMQGEVPEAYRAVNRRYYEELVRQ